MDNILEEFMNYLVEDGLDEAISLNEAKSDYIYSGLSVPVVYKGKTQNIGIAYKKELFKFRKDEIRDMIYERGAQRIVQSYVNKAPNNVEVFSLMYDGKNLRLLIYTEDSDEIYSDIVIMHK